MTYNVFVKADDIYKKIEELRKLSCIASKPYNRFRLSKKFLWICHYDSTEAVVCDKELTELIQEYCNRRIRELEEELKKL